MEERQRLEEERDVRLLRIIRSEMRKGCDDERQRYERKGKMAARGSGTTETIDDEKERLRRIIAPRTLGDAEDFEDEELLTLRMLVFKLGQTEKRKRGPDIPVGNSPPVITPEKKCMGMLLDEARARIEQLKLERGSDMGTMSTPTKIDLSLKHITTSCGPGGKEKFEQECLDFYDALPIDELKEACRREKVPYENSEYAIKRLIIQRSAVTYDPTTIPLPLSSILRMQTQSSKGVVLKEEATQEPYDSEASFSENDSE
ncbi:hypothetical protein CBR_g46899 [Chara braunii]|uniref:Uncharacterized protein n=1 Tax=Chara braunii TaxID=69332 RepID=A0A388M1I2_CHABU|nr:hypothetical protein CBR_g46899 [Chara braunii]|eukprot:GBG88333.1 hypothetical protein CBR_g46899 [Chara braunii]